MLCTPRQTTFVTRRNGGREQRSQGESRGAAITPRKRELGYELIENVFQTFPGILMRGSEEGWQAT